MASASKKGRGSKEGEKRGSARKLDETPSIAENKDEIDDSKIELSAEEESQTEELPPKDPTPEIVYEEPVLTKLIVDCFEGETSKGVYEGTGTATFKDGHKYEGEFSAGLMHGHGKYTWKDGVVYEGEFTQNQVTGKGLYTWTDGSSFEGGVLNGMRHGFGTYTAPDGKCSYQGEWNLGKKHGKGRMTYDAEGLSFYEGDWVWNVRHGWGTRQYASGNAYQGLWFKNVPHGEGTMRWLDKDQMYSGQWENGIQHGMGQHIWFLHRVAGSQYPLRNMYDGEFQQGLRQGCGTFYYANGARYEGEWKANKKHGKGKFVFKNGRVYEGIFENDHIMEYPTFNAECASTPDITAIRTRTPLPSEHMSIASNESRNTYGPSFQLEVEGLLAEFTETDREEEATQVIFVIMRHITSLRTIYNFYCKLGFEDSPDNTYVMSRLQFWRFLKDCCFHHQEISLAKMDRILTTDSSQLADCHNPYGKILFREFVNHLVTLAFYIYHEEHEGNGSVLSWCLSRLISDNVLPNACNVKGYIYTETRRSVNVTVHLDQVYEVYKSLCQPRKRYPHEPVLRMREFLHMLKSLRLVNSDLTPKLVLQILALDDSNVDDSEGCINLELEMTFLEFIEALVGCAQVFVTESVVKDPATPRPSTTLTQEHSILSATGSPSRQASQVNLEDGVDEAAAENDGLASETASPVPRAYSQTSAKTDKASKLPEAQHSNATGLGSEATPQASRASHINSAKKSAPDMEAADHTKKSASYMSSRSHVTEAALAQSMASLNTGRSDGAELNSEDEDYEEEELDEATRQFNFWTHQVHIFFVRKFFPAAQNHQVVNMRLKERVMCEAAGGGAGVRPETTAAPTSCVPDEDAESGDCDDAATDHPSNGDANERRESIKTDT